MVAIQNISKIDYPIKDFGKSHFKKTTGVFDKAKYFKSLSIWIEKTSFHKICSY